MKLQNLALVLDPHAHNTWFLWKFFDGFFKDSGKNLERVQIKTALNALKIRK